MKITITVEDENLEYFAKAESLSFESATADLGRLERNYQRRIDLELDGGDVMGESLKEEGI